MNAIAEPAHVEREAEERALPCWVCAVVPPPYWIAMTYRGQPVCRSCIDHFE